MISADVGCSFVGVLSVEQLECPVVAAQGEGDTAVKVVRLQSHGGLVCFVPCTGVVAT